ncbi:MAG TPA: hypothetical protein VHO03_17395 [Ignavibacteriales bacterium]|nr:hypothetical protein [Ignavibacteriales bacterium]
MKLKIFIPVLVTAALSVLSGCYTIIEHPDVQAKDENGYTYSNKVYFYDDCASCHEDQNRLGQMTRSEHMAMFKAHDDTSYDNGYYDNGNEDNYYSDQYYYPTQYYGDYGYYYNTPWWSTVTPPEDMTKTRDNNGRQTVQYNGRSRNESGDRGSNTRQSGDSPRLSSPTVSTSSGSSSSSGSNVQTNSTQSRTETRSSSDNNSSRSSNEQPRSRNNDSNRSSNSGRR